MRTLRDGLLGAGFVSVKGQKEAEALAFLQRDIEVAQQRKKIMEQEKRMGILSKTSSPDLFRREARKLLLGNPSLVQEILSIAYGQGMQNKKNKGGGRLIANLIQVREALKQGQADVEKLFPNK